MFGFSADLYQRLHAEEASVRANFFGQIRGVEFDLKSAGLNPADWECPVLATAAPPDHPGFYFATPYLGDHADHLGEIVAGWETKSLEAARKRGADILFPGDRVRATKVEIANLSPHPLALSVDQEMARVSLVADRAAGGTDELNPLLLHRRGYLANADEWRVLATLMERLAAIDDDSKEVNEILELRGRIDESKSTLERALSQVPQAADLGGLYSLGAHGLNVLEVERLINTAALLGYRQGRLEANRTMEPLARRAIERADQARDAGRGNADKGREEFGKRFFARNPQATAYAAAKAYCALPGNESDDHESVRRSMARLAPPTSPSYKGR